MVDKNDFKENLDLENTNKKQQEEKTDSKQILSDVEEILKDDVMVKMIMVKC